VNKTKGFGFCELLLPFKNIYLFIYFQSFTLKHLATKLKLPLPCEMKQRKFIVELEFGDIQSFKQYSMENNE
jgi:hypothetical protein